MRITIAQTLNARDNRGFANWPNENNMPNVKATIPYRFSEDIQYSFSEKQQDIIKKVVDRFNKDLAGCLFIR